MSKITTHVLDTSLGKPAEQVAITLYQENLDTRNTNTMTDSILETWIVVGKGQTDSDGRVFDLCNNENPLSEGNYKLKFDIQPYYQKTNQDTFYPFIEVVFKIARGGQHYHVPLLLNPFGYSTYRGS